MRIVKQQETTEKWEGAQKTAFTYWINTMLARRNCKIDDLMTGFQDGVKLIILAEVLVGKPIGQRYIEKPKMKAHKINNAFIALKFLREVGGMDHLTISAENLVSPEFLNLILGFCWQLLKTFQEPPDFDDDEDGAGGGGGGSGGGAGGKGKGKKGASSYESRLFNWVKKTLGDKYPDIDLSTGFKSEGFTNGKALLGLINEFDNDYINYEDYDPANCTENCVAALQLAEEHMKIPPIIDGEELAEGNVGDKQLVLYLSLMYNAYSDREKGQSVESLQKKIKEREAHLRALKEENLKLKENFNTLSENLSTLQVSFTETEQDTSSLTLASKETEEQLTSLKEEWSSSQEQWQDEISKLKSKLQAMMAEDDASTIELQNQWDQSQESRDKLREELRKAKETLTKEKEEMEAKNRRLLKNEKRAKKMKEELEEILQSQQETFDASIVDFRKHFIIHVSDMNTWKPYLEEDRDYKEKPTPTLPLDSSESFNLQVTELTTNCRVGNKSLRELLNLYETETDEIVSVTIGKKQKRTKKYAWEQQFPEDIKLTVERVQSSPRVVKGSSGKAVSVTAGSKSPRGGGRKRAEAGGKQRK